MICKEVSNLSSDRGTESVPMIPAKKIRIEWSDEMVETLISSYQASDCLWNMTISEYRDQTKKSLALEDIGVSNWLLECTVDSFVFHNWTPNK